MKRKQSLIGGLDRILSVREASDLLSISVEELLKFYAGQREISLSNLLKRICRSNPIYHFPLIGEPTNTLKGVMDATGKGRSWSLFFLERNCVRTWCVGVHYLYAKGDVDNAWRKESLCGTNGFPSSRFLEFTGWIFGSFCNRLQMESSKSVPDRENSLFHVKTSRCYGREWQSNRKEG